MSTDFNSNEYLHRMQEWWRAANYLSAAQLYLLDDPLLKRPLTMKDVKKKIVGHWGTVPGQNFVTVNLNRVINKYDLDMILLSGPGHGGNFYIANDYLDGTYSEVYPNITQDEKGLQKLFKQFSFPGGVPSHCAPETPGSINEGGELGYSLAHGFGAVFDNPDLIAAVIVGDGEAETGPLATSWHSNKFLNPEHDGAVLPILHLNGYKISNPTILSRISKDELTSLMHGYGWKPYFVEGDDPEKMFPLMAETMDKVIEEIRAIQKNARENHDDTRPFWPMIVLRTPKGWTAPKKVDGVPIEGSFHAHQVPVEIKDEEHLHILEDWLKSYHPEELFDENGTLKDEIRSLSPIGDHRLGANPHANGGKLLRDLIMPDFRDYAVDVKEPGAAEAQDMMELGKFVRDIFKANDKARNFRIFSPDEGMSNRLNHAFEAENRPWEAEMLPTDEHLARDGRIMDGMLSEHMCEGWLEGYLLTGRHGFFDSYEAFVRVVDSMAAQHAKWLKVCNQMPWRQDIASLNFILTSHIWQQDHNGFTHQDPGFMDHIANKKADVVRIYLPADTNCLLSTMDHCLRSRNYVNVVIASKHPRPQWFSMEEAVNLCTQGLGIIDWASNDKGCEPDVVMACAGDTPTLETLAAVSILRKELPDLKIRVINVVDLFKLQPSQEHPHGLSDAQYDMLFTTDKPIIFAFHGYPTLIHELTYRRHNRNLHVRGYKEEGTITTPFDMRVQNDIDRFHLVEDVLLRLPQDKFHDQTAHLFQQMENKLVEHRQYIREYGQDLPEVANWKWQKG
ncbi:MAG: phosphoketolase family protein [Erysipelotrichaceae bacterium]|jgi:xylulose-5-phosphate/fructose-6-phosphate phosphoketolase|nr:phosphoketolase family protein [Erysipelotrichaceae bacterium]MCI1325706.1 phosphoketolase family protein [Solobacterium sp.]MCH4043874.1 phosphoketolase family protein [Erysipelotrichaceae bacterium]MCH4121090.1 phosphoketolase family protein [Erysipelotrichaceae bacterium]MCI1364156.1 phosphoketolase family protein [Solobacterium sp.]